MELNNGVNIKNEMSLHTYLYDLIIENYIERERQYAKDHPEHKAWLAYRGERIFRVANYCVHRWAGDLLEIGCLHGGLTARFGQLAREQERRVMAVDPWIPGHVNCTENSYELFLKRIKGIIGSVDIVQKKSQDPEAIELIKNRPLCFAYIDGEHTYSAVLSDIMAVAHCSGIIAVDDLYIEGVERAFWEGAHVTTRRVLHHPHFCEGYLLPTEAVK